MLNIREFNGLTKSEIKKINKAGFGFVGEYYTEKYDDCFITVVASCFDPEYDHIVSTVSMSVCLFDRRMSKVFSVKKV